MISKSKMGFRRQLRHHERHPTGETCGRKKHSFDSRKAAVRYAKIITNRRGGALAPYECRLCGQWHLTTVREPIR